MENLDIIIGREDGTNRLAMLVNGTKKQAAGNPNSVPMTVSRLKPAQMTGHCRIVTQGNDVWIYNLNPQNVTYVNGEPICADGSYPTQLSAKDKVQLGYPQDNGESYSVNILSALKAANWSADIHHLLHVWKQYDYDNEKIDISQQRMNAMQSVTGILSMGATAALFVPNPTIVSLRPVLITIALALMVVFAVFRFRKGNMGPVQKKRLNEQFHRDYVCPCCGQFLGNIPGNELISLGKCTKCGISYAS